MFVFLNKAIVPESEARISVFDHGFLYGDGIYETMRSYDGIVFMYDEHLERLARSAAFIRLAIPDREFISDAINKTLLANKLSDAYIRVTISRGAGPIGLDPDLCAVPTVVVIAREFSGYPESHYTEGTKIIIAKTRRNLSEALNPEIKSLNFLNNILAKIEAKERDAAEAVMLNADGYIAEGTVSNIFFISDGRLCTPSVEAGILSGITREIIIRVSQHAGIPVREGLFYPEDLYRATEIFYTNTSSEISPVCQIQNVGLSVGAVTKHLLALYRAEVRSYIEARK